MAEYCLPKNLLGVFLKATGRDGPLDPFRLNKMDSEDRVAALAEYLGEDDAKKINQAFEEKLLLRYKEGLEDWRDQTLRSVTNPKIRENIVEQIKGYNKILNPGERQQFLAGLAEKRLGVAVTRDEAKEIMDLANTAKTAKNAWQKTLDQNIIVKNGDFSNPIVQTRLAYGNALLDLRDKIEELKPEGKSFSNTVLNVANMPKTLATGLLHFSAIGVQGWGVISQARTWEAFVQQFRYFKDEANYRELESYIISHPDYQFAVDGKLGLTHVTDKLSTREEAIQSSLIQDANQYLKDKYGVPNVFGASSRAFTGFLNYTRFNRFTDLLNAARSVDESSVALGSQTVKDLASVVNNFTGRANVDSSLFGVNPENVDSFIGRNQALLNGIFFAPRKIAATVQMFNPLEYARLYKNAAETGNFTAANAAVRQLTGSLIATGSVLYLAKSMGYQVDFDPRSQNFLKIQLPDGEKLDVTGGNAIYVRLIARMITNSEVTSHGKEIELGQGYKPTTRGDLVEQYIRGKLSPVAGAIVDAVAGMNEIGQPFNPADPSTYNAEQGRIEPILFSSLMNYYMNQPNKSVSDIPALSGLFGVNVESPLPPPSLYGMTPLGDQVNWNGSLSEDKTPVSIAMEKVGVPERFPSKTINSVPLSDEQYKQYIGASGHLTTTLLTPIVTSPGWNSIPKNSQISIIKEYTQAARSAAQSMIIAKNPEILKQSIENQRKKALGQ